MTRELVGLIIRCNTAESYFDVGRIVHLDRDRETVYYIPCPGKRSGKGSFKSWYMPSPRKKLVAELEGLNHDEEFDGQLTLVPFVEPRQWRLTDEQLKAGICQNGLVGKRAKLNKWLEEREESLRWIAPIITEYKEVGNLIEFDAYKAAVKQRAEELLHSDATRVRRALLLWMFGCGDPNALLPCRYLQGGAGQRKEFTEKPGRRQKDFDEKLKPTNGYVTSQEDRDNLSRGWDLHKKKGVSIHTAYLKTCAQFWPGSLSVKGSDGKDLYLALPDERPTETEFYNAARSRGCTGAARRNLSEHVHNLCARELRGSSKSGVMAVGQVALIDSTSEDQTPVSSTSRHIVLPSTSRTTVIDVRTEYILGIYCGFEHASTLTSLLAILSAASSKVEFCARYGVHITEDQWFQRMPKRIRGDNGELKSRLGIDTVNNVGASIEFTASYAAVLKSLVEASHHSLHARADHRAAGSTKGRRQLRGERDRKKDACRTFEQNMQFVIREILRHNNEQPVPHLLTPQMLKDNVIPTRAEIYKWYVAKGYVASAPTNIETLRVRCLPALTGVIHRDGIHIYNPVEPRELIDGLVFNSAWLRQSGLCIKSSKRAEQRSVEIKLSPNELGHCYFEYGGQLHRLENQALDAGSRELALVEYLKFSEARKSAARALRAGLDEADYERIKDNDECNRAAKKSKREEAEAIAKQGGQLTPPAKQSLRENVIREKRIHYLEKLGIDAAQQSSVNASNPIPEAPSSSSISSTGGAKSNDEINESEALDATAALMAGYRANRKFID
jgi:hypothetical protein